MTAVDFFGRRFRDAPNAMLDDSGADLGTHLGDWCGEVPGATLVTSRLEPVPTRFEVDDEGWHAPVIDLDLPCHYEPSTTPGHGHLYVNRVMPWADVVKLLDVMTEVGIVQQGFRDAAIKRGYAAVRTPWTRKPEPPEQETAAVDDPFEVTS